MEGRNHLVGWGFVVVAVVVVRLVMVLIVVASLVLSVIPPLLPFDVNPLRSQRSKIFVPEDLE